jgi:UPF0042 nucleotide-binding protein
MRLLIVTGMSGAGKSKVIDALEDIGYFCVDNFPPRLTPTFAKLICSSKEQYELVAMVMDARAGAAFDDVFWALDQLKENSIAFEVVFLDASDEVLRRRYKETRRQHPICAQQPALGLSGAISAERNLLAGLRTKADLYINTSDLSLADCKTRIAQLFSENADDTLQIHFTSFGFKNGTPRDCDLLFDVRCLPNPFYEPHLKTHSGLEDVIDAYVFSFEESQKLFAMMRDLLLFSLPLYQKEGKRSLSVAVGCTGGMHRSVLFARRLASVLQEKNYTVHITHRDLPSPLQQ